VLFPRNNRKKKKKRKKAIIYTEKDYALRFSRTQSYFDKSLTIRLLIGGVFAIFLFLFLHFRETYVETLELGTKAKKYVVAQVDFAFPDEEATIILKQEAAHEIGTIYRIKEEEIQKKATQFQRDLTRKNGESVKKNDFEAIALALDRITDWLSQSRFTGIHTLQAIDKFSSEEIPIPLQYFFPFIPLETDERLPIQFWTYLERNAFSEEAISVSMSRLVLNYFEPLEWDFEIDQGVEYTFRKLAQAKIPEKYVRVRAGERLIDQGEKVTTRHIAMLQAMKEKLDQKRNLFDLYSIGGTLLMTLLLMGVAIVYLRENHHDIYYSNRKLALLAT